MMSAVPPPLPPRPRGATPRFALPCAALLLLAAAPVSAQVALTALDTPYTQTFDTLPASGSTTWSNNTTIAGWYHQRTGTGTTVVANDGASNAGNLYSYGSGTASDRALGSLGSGNAAVGNIFYGVRLRNDTGSTITSLDIAYNGEQWRNGGAPSQTATFSYVLGAPAVTGSLAEFQAAGTAVAALNLTSPTTGGTASALNGNSVRTQPSTTISGLSIAPGTEIMLRWADPDHASSDHGLAVDDLVVTPRGSSPVPQLSIEDVENNEGNGANGTYEFIVTLSAPAPAGGVTFDIATADDTATAPADYVARALTSQTIPAGQTSYSFDVEVVADTTPESDEQFLVEVDNVVGANVTDATALGILYNDDGGAQISVGSASVVEGNGGGTTPLVFAITLSEPAPAGGVTFDIATSDGTATAPSDYASRTLTAQTIAAGQSSTTFEVAVVADAVPEADETLTVTVSNVIGALLGNASATGTITNDDVAPFDLIHAIQGSGETSPMVGATVTIEAVVIGSYQGAGKLSGFFVQEEDADADANPATSEGMFVFCAACPVAVAEGQRVRVTGVVSEFFGTTEITASTAPSVLVVDAGNHLADVTPASIALPIAGDVNAFYEARENMRVRYTDTLQVAEYFQLARYGQVTLFQGERPRQFTADNVPNASAYNAHLADLARRRVLLDDENNTDNGVLSGTDGQQAMYLPHANGGFGIGTQGVDFFRGGDTVSNLTGVLHWSFAGFTGTDAWRIRPTQATPATFTVANPRPASAPAVDGAIKAAGVNVLNYFSTIDTTSSNNSGNCGPSGSMDCRGADSAAELARQRERTSIVLCGLDADVVGLVEIENHPGGAALTDLIGAVNTRCGGSQPYALAGSGNAVGSDAIRVALMYRTNVLAPVGSLLVDTNAIHNRPPNAQTFDVVDPANPAFGERFTAIANHFKSKSCSGAGGADADSGDGQACYASRRTQQAARLLTWIDGTVVPAAGDDDVLVLGDLNAYASETPITTLEAGGYTDLISTLLDHDTGYSYLFDGQLGHLDYAMASESLLGQVAGIAPWHINADEVPVFDYNDEVRDTGEAAFEEEPDGSALTPPRTLHLANSPFRASDHDPVLVGLFPTGATADIGIAIADAPDPVTAGTQLVYTVTVNNAGPAAAANAAWSGTLPAGTTFATLASAGGWSCTTPVVGAGGPVSCTRAAFASGNAVFTLGVNVDAATPAASTLAFLVTASATNAGGATGDDSATASTTVAAAPVGLLSIAPTSVDFGTVTVGDTSTEAVVTLTNDGDASLEIAALTATQAPFARSGGTCALTLPIVLASDASCTLAYTFTPTAAGTAGQTLQVDSDANDGTIVLSGDGELALEADVAVSIDNGRSLVGVGEVLDYVIVVGNATGPSTATVTVSAALPPQLADGVWVCVADAGATCADGSGATLSDVAVLPAGTEVTYVYSATVLPGTEGQTIELGVTATVAAPIVDPDPSNNSASDAPADVVENPVFGDGFETLSQPSASDVSAAK